MRRSTNLSLRVLCLSGSHKPRKPARVLRILASIDLGKVCQWLKECKAVVESTSSNGRVSFMQLSKTSFTARSALALSGHAGLAWTDIMARLRTQACRGS